MPKTARTQWIFRSSDFKVPLSTSRKTSMNKTTMLLYLLDIRGVFYKMATYRYLLKLCTQVFCFDIC